MSEIPEPKQTSYSYSAITNEHIKNLYAQIENECQKPVPAEIKCTGTLTQKDIYEAIIAFKNDHPDIFWIKNTFSYYDYDGSTYVELFYISSGTTLETQKEKFNEALNDFVNNATMYSSEYERESMSTIILFQIAHMMTRLPTTITQKEMSVPPTEFLLTVKPYVKDMPGHFSFCATSSALNV